MDADSVFDGLILLVGALFGILKQLLLYVLSFLYLLASPLLYLGHGLLTLALLPLRIVLKFEVGYLSTLTGWFFSLIHALTRLQAFIYFVTGAVLTGITVGLFLHFAGDFLSQLLWLHDTSPPPHQTDLVDKNDPLVDWEYKWRDQYPPSTILEEEETSQGSG